MDQRSHVGFPPLTLLHLFKKFISFHENSTDLIDKRERTTIRAHFNKYRIFAEFLNEKELLNITPVEFKITIARSYFKWLYSKGYCHNYCIKVLGSIKSALTHGAANELIPYNPLSALKVKKIPPPDPVHLSIKDIEKLERFNPPMITLEKAKDMFLFQCFTGLAYSDMTDLQKGNIFLYKHKQYISKRRNKTKVEAVIPYFPKAKKLFEKHNYNMKLLSNGKYNEALKLLASYLGFQQNLTTHIGRKTFAMLMLNTEQYPIEALSKILGHKSTRTVEEYYTRKTVDLVHNAVIEHETRQREVSYDHTEYRQRA